MAKIHILEIGRSVHQKPGEYCCTYLNDRRISGAKPWGGFVAERVIKISDDDLREAIMPPPPNQGGTHEKG